MAHRVSDLPPFRQIANDLRTRILSGEFQPGDQLPSRQTLMGQWGVVERTVQHAYDVLRSEGLVVTMLGRGMFVRERPQRIRRLLSDLTSPTQGGFDASLARYGLRSEVHNRVEEVPAPRWVADELGLEPGDQVLMRDRTMAAAGQPPIQLSTSYLPLDVVAHVERTLGQPWLHQEKTGPGGMDQRMRDAGYRFTAEHVVGARAASADEGRALQMPPGVPVLLVTRWHRVPDGRVIHVQQIIGDSSRMEWGDSFGPEPRQG